jgi:sulfur carrier protein ThiS
VTVMVEGRSRSLPAGLTIAQVLERLELPAMAGDLLAVDHNVLRKGAYPPRVLVNGQPARATQRLHRGDRITVARGQSRIEPVTRAIQQHAGSRPATRCGRFPRVRPGRLGPRELSGRVEAMSSTRRDPETGLMGEGEQSADHAWQALRRHGGRRLLRDAFLRFRSGDGFSDARALGLRLRLAAVPLLIAAISSARAWC